MIREVEPPIVNTCMCEYCGRVISFEKEDITSVQMHIQEFREEVKCLCGSMTPVNDSMARIKFSK